MSDFSPSMELRGQARGFLSTGAKARLAGKEGPMKTASFVINIGFGLGIALGAVALLVL